MKVKGQLDALLTLLPGERALGMHWLGEWVGTTFGLDSMAKRKILARTDDRTPVFRPLPSCDSNRGAPSPINRLKPKLV
jgi:hypothetical protein